MKNSLKRGSAMRKVLKKLEKNTVNIKKLKAIEIFGGKGNWHLQEYANKVKSIEICEIRADFRDYLKNAYPMAKINIVNSIEYISSSKNSFYDFIVIDNPQGVFGIDNSYCEHFDILDHIEKIVSKDCVIIFNVNINPFDYQTKKLWQKRREKFYGINSTNKLDMKFLYSFYSKYMEAKELEIKNIFSVSRLKDHNHKKDHLHYMVLKLENKKNDCKSSNK